MPTTAELLPMSRNCAAQCRRSDPFVLILRSTLRTYAETEPTGDAAEIPMYAPAKPLRIGLLTDFLSVPYANGATLATQFLYREFAARGDDATVIGPGDPNATEVELPNKRIALPSLPLRNYPGVRLPFPSRATLQAVAGQHFDVLLGQTGSALKHLGVWLRRQRRVPFLTVNTIHMPSLYDALLPNVLHNLSFSHRVFLNSVIPAVERHWVALFNQSDGLIVLSAGLKRYWAERGVEVPIHVIRRCIEPQIFDARSGIDPFDRAAPPGYRALVVCRHTREKGVSRLIRIFAKHVFPRIPEATLTLVGDGVDHDNFKALAASLGVGGRTFFPGMCSVRQTPDWYRHADLFVYTSMSETYGQVISEAMWCGLPVVAFKDRMGVSEQVVDGETGYLVEPGSNGNASHSDRFFGDKVVELLKSAHVRHIMGSHSRRVATELSDPQRCVDRYYRTFDEARRHLASTLPKTIDRARKDYSVLAQWSAMHSVLAAFSLLRAPAQLNRHGHRQPRWEAPFTEDQAKALHDGARFASLQS